ncbi:MAG: MBL fold metallo-hydrolase [Clostridium sp.]
MDEVGGTMKLKCIGSSSDGNCYVLENDTEALVIEAGLPFKEVEKTLDFNISKIACVIASHSHKDHSKYLHEYERAGINTFKPYELEVHKQTRKYGGFTIHSFEVEHDVICVGYLIEHKDIGRLVFVTDTEYVKYCFAKQKPNHIMIESNYSKELLSDDPTKREHVLTGHMEINTACEFIKKNHTVHLKNVVLLHLSDSSGDAELFKAKASEVARCNVYVAKKGIEVNLDLIPF